jgi:hypothetical protein
VIAFQPLRSALLRGAPEGCEPQAFDPSVDADALTRVRDLFNSYGGQTGTLRLRHQTHCLRARVLKENLAREAAPPDPTLIELS